MEFDAVILSGGRSSRLGGVPKPALMHDGATLLERALQAAGGASAVAVVGPDPGTLPPGVLACREDPPFTGPAAAIAAGLSALARRARDRHRAPAPYTLVLACDMPRAQAAVRALLEAAADGPPGDGLMAVSADGRRQPLVGLYGTDVLQRHISDAARRGALANAPVFGLLARLDVREVGVPGGSTDDVDTWDDAAALGVTGPPGVHGGDNHGQDPAPGAPELKSTLEADSEKPG
ncbi:molybdenum cofactor guanylyltransferase [Arthrobacter sp. EPSL27]|uniref:molybdenum cofactor guanylyltransferase n=1 Tax=Arthrobacter sp. EPSL27 TaxID=1745378 RepID=UPI000AEB4DE2|nr:NTP transferase domain-containing protein [Arthrobacter sp. EPSL27]